MGREKHLADLQSWYPHVETFGDGEYVGIKPLMFHWTMFKGHLDIEHGWEDHWCFVDEDLARKQLEEWRCRGFEGEPEGWHRHPKTGRRRVDGDPETEYIAS